MSHPFETVSLKRLSQCHPRFWERIEMSKVRAEIELNKFKRELGEDSDRTKRMEAVK